MSSRQRSFRIFAFAEQFAVGVGILARVDGVCFEEPFGDMINEDSVIWQRLQTEHWDGVLKSLVGRHAQLTQSRFAEALIRDWDREQPKFWQIVPKEMFDRLDNPTTREAEEAERA